MTSDTVNHRFSLFSYYLISLLALTLAGLIYKVLFVVYNPAPFSGLALTDVIYALFWGVRFDLASAAVFSLVSCLILWLSYRLRLYSQESHVILANRLLVIMLLLQVSLQMSDALYFAESGRHVSYEMRDVFIDASGLFMTAVSHHALFLVLGYALAFVLILVTLRFTGRILCGASGSVPAPADTVLSRLGASYEFRLFVILLLSVVLVRGGVTGLPQSVISAFKIGDAKQAVISMNGAYSVVYGAINSTKEIDRVTVKLPADTDTHAVMNSLYPEIPDTDATAEQSLKRYNLVFILMEGWPADIMSAYGYEQDTTPFFSSLKERSHAPLGAIAGGLRTTEGIYATFCSQQNPLGETVAQSSLQNNQYRCLPDMLKDRGWHTAFFQGTHKETSGTGAFAQSLGFTDSFAVEDMPDGRYERNYWGAHDPDIYDFVLEKLDAMPEPFLVGVNTNSTHDIKLPAGEKPRFGERNRQQKYMNILHFSDRAMGEFFEKIRSRSYYHNTVFVLMSDHTTGGSRNGVAAKFYIPAIIYGDGIVPAEKINRFISQRDIAPTILDIIGMPASSSFSGKSFWQQHRTADQDEFFADYFTAGSIGWLNKDRLVETSVNNPADMKCYRITDNLPDAKTVDCDAGFKNDSMQSLVFTSYSQALLFEGRTKMFYEFAESR